MDFLAIVRNGKDNSIYRLDIDDTLFDDIRLTFTIPADKWRDPVVLRTEFDDSYTLEDGQLFEIKKFAMPPDMLNAMRFPKECGEFKLDSQGIADLKAIVAVNTTSGAGGVTAMFKIISKGKKHEPSKSLMVMSKRNGYTKVTDPAISFDDKLAALYEHGALIFKSPSTVKQVLSLKDYIKEANDLEIVAFLENKFEGDAEKFLANADSWTRKRFASLMESDVFERMSSLDIYDAAKSFSSDIPMHLSMDRKKLVLPQAKQDIRMALKFLNEEYYKGVLTGKDYQTHSKKPLGKAEKRAGKPGKKELNFR
jgi:hypothetical protein